MELRKEYSYRIDKYGNVKVKEYENLKEYFSKEIIFSKKDGLKSFEEKIDSEKTNVSRVWLLFASNDNSKWECLQVAQSKNKVKSEIKKDIKYLFDNFNYNSENISYMNSAFYENVCPKATNEEYRQLLYSKIGSEYEYFHICFLNVDEYLRIKPDNKINETDMDRIIQICKNQYAEAKIAYQTLAVYWRMFTSGIDGQTIDYIAKHTSEFN